MELTEDHVFVIIMTLLLGTFFMAWTSERNVTAFALECVRSGGTYEDRECTR